MEENLILEGLLSMVTELKEKQEGYAQASRPGQNWFKFTAQNSIKTRTVRCIKSPVEYIYN